MSRQQGWSPERLAQLRAQTGLAPKTEAGSLLPYQTDFGRLIEGTPSGVVQPRDSDELARAIRFAHEHHLSLTLRGQGLSQGGQSVATGGITIDTRQLVGFEEPNANDQTITCEAGATWAKVLERCAPLGLTPTVMPANLDLTVGGVLSVGGIGSTSHLYGPAVSNVLELEAVTGAGERHRASAQHNPELFHALLGGTGRCGVILRARLNLRRFQPLVRTFYLLYDRIDIWLEDQARLAGSAEPPIAMEGFVSSAGMGLRNHPGARRPFGVWFYGLHVSWEYPPDRPPAAEVKLRGLRPYRMVHTEDAETRAFFHRYEPRFRAMRALGAWDQPHPWVEAFLSLGQIQEILPSLLEELPLALGDGHRLMLVADRHLPPLLAVPDQRPLCAFAILPVGLPSSMTIDLIQALRSAHDRLTAVGGKRYLSGWLDMMTDEAWRRHFGPRFSDWVGCKRRFDPRGVLTSALFPAHPQPSEQLS